jgi:putative ABC transport system permease protein
MSAPRNLLRYLRFWGGRRKSDIDQEIGFHADMRARDFMARGMAADEAERAAWARLGNIDHARQECLTIIDRQERRMNRLLFLDTLKQDVRFGARTLWRQPTWTAVAVLTIALGIGANTAVFSAVDALILHPIDFRDANRIVTVYRANPSLRFSVSPTVQQAVAWKANARTLDGLEAFANTEMTLTGRGDPKSVKAGHISETFNDFAGVPNILGRSFIATDTARGAAPVVVLSESYWRRELAANPAVIGSTMALDRRPRTIVGVASHRLRLPSSFIGPVDLFVPFRTEGLMGVSVAARLRKDVTIASAQAEMDSLSARAHADRPINGKVMSAKLTGLAEGVWFRKPLMMLLGAVALLLLIVCANVAHLLLARGAARAREFAIRRAVGADAGRIVRQVLTESLLLAVAGCAIGLAVGQAGIRAIISLRPQNMSQLADIGLDTRVLAAAVITALATGAIFGLVAARDALRTSGDALRSATAGGSSSPRRQRMRMVLVTSEIAISAMLLVGAALLTRTVANLLRKDPGFAPEGLYSMQFQLPEKWGDSSRRRLLAAELLSRARTMPGVESATIASSPPGSASVLFGDWEAEGASAAVPTGLTATVEIRPEHFGVMRQRIIDGRAFDAGSRSRDEIIVSEALAKRLFPGGRAAGRRARIASPGAAPDAQPSWQIVAGVVSNSAVMGLGSSESDFALYSPTESASDFGGPTLVLRIKPGAPVPATELRKMSLSVAPGFPPPAVVSAASTLKESIAMQRFTMTLLTAFTVLSVFLASVGLYGVIAFIVGQRTREIGIRMALGASRGTVAGLIGSQVAWICGTGLIGGLIAAGFATKTLKSMLYGVEPMDPLSFVVGALILVAVVTLACLAPMRRAVRVDPAITMRAE